MRPIQHDKMRIFFDAIENFFQIFMDDYFRNILFLTLNCSLDFIHLSLHVDAFISGGKERIFNIIIYDSHGVKRQV